MVTLGIASELQIKQLIRGTIIFAELELKVDVTATMFVMGLDCCKYPPSTHIIIPDIFTWLCWITLPARSEDTLVGAPKSVNRGCPSIVKKISVMSCHRYLCYIYFLIWSKLPPALSMFQALVQKTPSTASLKCDQPRLTSEYRACPLMDKLCRAAA